MSETQKIECKPTRWFIFRAVVMLLMFGVFAVLFYKDGSKGYRKKNEAFFLHKAFESAAKEFSDLSKTGGLTPESWRDYAAKRTVLLPEDRSVLPAAMPNPHPWPEILHDFRKMKDTQWNHLWREYTGTKGMDENVPEEPYTARKINEQWIVFWISLVLASAAGFFLVRTLGRRISADGEAVTDQCGRRVPYADLRVLDLRKWETKGLAFIDFEGPSGKGRLRIDGLTYGGFKAEEGQPAEELMKRIRSRFAGEIIEFTAAPETSEDSPAGKSEDKGA